MPFQVSPGVNVSEIDLTTVVPAVSTTEGALAGVFKWGPVNTRVLVDSEETLAARFGKPQTGFNPETFFTAANFLAYGNKLYVTRVADVGAKNAAVGTAPRVDNEDDLSCIGTANHWVAKYPGELGNSIKVSLCRTANDYLESSTATIAIAAGSSTGTTSADLSTGGSGADLIVVGDVLKVGNTNPGVGIHYLTVKAIDTTTITFEQKYTGAVAIAGSTHTVERLWGHHNLVSSAPGTSAYVEAKGGVGDEVHVVVSDEDGLITGEKGSILEVFEGLSRATDAKTESGESNFWCDVIDSRSNYVWGKSAYGLAANTTEAA